MAYVGNTPTTQSFISGTDYFSGTGSQTAFTLSRVTASQNDIEVVVNNVVQQPNSAYTVSSTTLTFTSAPSSGTNNIYVRYLSTTTQTITPAQGTVSWNTLDTNTQGDLGISFKNRVINGAMVISQANAGASVTQTTNNLYPVDRFLISGSVTSKFTGQQNAASVTPPAGFVNYLGCTSSSAYVVGASEIFSVQQRIEGYNIADLGWGSANAKTITLLFWVRSSLTGTFGGSLRNSGQTRSYPFSYTISAANTWEQKAITIGGDTSGTWLTDNGIGVQITWSLGTGSTLSATAGAWAAGNYGSATGATSVVGTSSATFYITGVQFETGTQATTFDYRNYGTELALCQRYYSKTFDTGTAPSQNSNNFAGALTTLIAGSAFIGNTILTWRYPVSMRAVPTITVFTPGSNASFPNCINDSGGVYSAATTTSLGVNGTAVYNSGSALSTNAFGYVHLVASIEL